jgi:hypothetical protein
MFKVLPTANPDFREIQECTNRIERLLRDETTLSPAGYQELVECLAGLAQLWRRHVKAFIEAAGPGRFEDSHLSIFVAQLCKDSSVLADQLESLSAAGWPRTTGLGLTAIRLRARELLAAIARQIEKEQSVVRPIVQLIEPKSSPGEAAGTVSQPISSLPS